VPDDSDTLRAVTCTITKLEVAAEDAFLRWRAGDDEHLQDIVRQELEAQGRGECTIFVAAQHDQLIGTVQLVYHHEDPELANGTTRGYVQALEVSSGHRRQGVGVALMRHLEDSAREQGFSSLALMMEPDNRVALELYERLGYSVFKTSSWSWKEREYETLCFEKWL
jgi:ribosomal protein S18 acetylase RimI-like enzyme